MGAWFFTNQSNVTKEPDMKTMAEFMSTFPDWEKKKAKEKDKEPKKVFTWWEATKIRMLLFPVYGAFFFYAATVFWYYNKEWIRVVFE